MLFKCKYCGASSGFFKRKHKECEEKHNLAVSHILDLVTQSISDPDQAYSAIGNKVSLISSSGYVNPEEADKLVVEAIRSYLESDPQIDSYVVESYLASLPSTCQTEIQNSDEYSEYWKRQFALYLLSLNVFGAIGEEQAKRIHSLFQLKIPKLTFVLQAVFLTELARRIEAILEDGIIEPQEEQDLDEYLIATELKDSEVLQCSEAYERLTQSLVLRDIKSGNITDRCSFSNLPIVLGKTERLVWVHANIEGYEQKTGRKRVGKSNGISVRICKGVYYRTGASGGYLVDYQYEDNLGSGLLVITNKNLIFVGSKSVKLPIGKIISYTPYDDGVEIVKDGATPKSYTFVGMNPWFLINAIQLLA